MCSILGNYKRVHESFLAPIRLRSPIRGQRSFRGRNQHDSRFVGGSARPGLFSNALDYPTTGTKDARGNDFDPVQPTLPATALKRLFRSAALINSWVLVPASVKRAQVLRRYMSSCLVTETSAAQGHVLITTKRNINGEIMISRMLTAIIIYDVLVTG